MKIKCENCQVETSNPKFCSSSCAASYNNKRFPKRKRKKRYCKHCGKDITRSKGQPAVVTVCNDCNRNVVNWDGIRLCDMHGLRSYQKSSRIRERARQTYRNSNLSKECVICRYNKHYEVCHIKPIKEFEGSAMVVDINSLSNLVALCRNCHWEFDHGILSKEFILRAKEDLNPRPCG